LAIGLVIGIYLGIGIDYSEVLSNGIVMRSQDEMLVSGIHCGFILFWVIASFFNKKRDWEPLFTRWDFYGRYRKVRSGTKIGSR
jgi:hypothetical protein